MLDFNTVNVTQTLKNGADTPMDFGQDLHPQFAIAFFIIIAVLLTLDLAVFNRKSHTVSLRSSLIWTFFWVSIAASFNIALYYGLGKESAVLFLTSYVVELSLSVDNLFVFLLIFSSFKIPEQYQHRVLFWGILGALIMRAICIWLGVEALQRYAWLTYVFGAILIYSGLKSLRKNDEAEDPSQGKIASIIKRWIPVSKNFDGEKFFTIENGKKTATPLFLALIIVELSDLIFAVDSIPAVLAITQDPLIVYSSNVFAILGLRSIYFALSHIVQLFRFLNYALSFILIFVGTKIMIAHFYKIPVTIALSFIIGSLVAAVLASIVIKPLPKNVLDE
jgi:tellurite resistance protein TerC